MTAFVGGIRFGLLLGIAIAVGIIAGVMLSREPPRVLTVHLPNGHPVVCIDFHQWGTCDMNGFVSGLPEVK